MRRVLRQVITGLVSILLDAILQSTGGGGSGGGVGGGGGVRRAGAREGGGGGAGPGGAEARAARGPVSAQTRRCVCVSAHSAEPPLKEQAGRDCACGEGRPPPRARAGSDPAPRSGAGHPGGSRRTWMEAGSKVRAFSWPPWHVSFCFVHSGALHLQGCLHLVYCCPRKAIRFLHLDAPLGLLRRKWPSSHVLGTSRPCLCQ